MRTFLRILLSLLAGVLSFTVMRWGLYSAISVDFRMNPVQTILYCALAILCFPLFVIIRLLRKPEWWLWIAACAYLVVYSALDWRSCAAMGICGSVAGTVWQTLKTHSALAFFGAAIASSAATVLLDGSPKR
jgi:hypothetical protein